jgi:hypothetical protein
MILLIISFTFFILFVYRFLNSTYVSAQASFIIGAEEKFLNNITGVLYLKETISFEDFKENFRTTFEKFPQFKKKLIRPKYFGWPHLVRKSFFSQKD